MYTKELQYINGYRMFTDMLNNLEKNQKDQIGKNSSANSSYHHNSNKVNKNFLDVLDERMDEMEKMKDVLKGNSYHLESNKKKEDRCKKELLPKKGPQSKLN